jgi:hypothetical protein
MRIHVIPAEAGIQKRLGPGFRRDDEYGHSGRTLEQCYIGSQLHIWLDAFHGNGYSLPDFQPCLNRAAA